MQDCKRNYVSYVNNCSCTHSYYVVFDNVPLKFVENVFQTHWIYYLKYYTRDNKSDLFFSKPDNRDRQPSKNKTPLIQIEYVNEFIEKLPAVPSHYCRNSSNKKNT